MSSDAAPAPDRTWDIVATVVLLLLLCAGGLVASFAGLTLVFASDSCGVTSECSTGGIALGVLIAVAAPWVAIVAMGTWAVVRLVRRKLAWWVALLAIPLWGLIFALGVAVTFAAVG